MIVGAGPAGSSAAIRLSQAGRRILLVDKAEFPRHKLCGEFVSPECLDHLDALGVAIRLTLLQPPTNEKTVFYSSSGRSLSVPSRWLAKNRRASIGLSRFELDRLLLDRASDSGTTVRTGVSLVGCAKNVDGTIRLRLRGQDGSECEVRAPAVVDATGRGRYVARMFDRKSSPVKADQIAFKAHLRNVQIGPNACEIYSYPGGYGGCSAVESGNFNLCFIVAAECVRAIGNDPQNVFDSVLLTNKRAGEVLSQNQVCGEWLSVPISHYGSREPAPSAGVFAIGDAAAFIDPFTGSGIAMALQSSKLLFEAFQRSADLESVAELYRHAHDKAFRRRLEICSRLRGLSRSPKLAEMAIAALSQSSFVTRSLARFTR